MQGVWLILDSLIAILALLAGFFLYKVVSERKVGEAGARAERILQDAAHEAENRRKTAELEAREIALKARAALDEESRRREREVQRIEQRVLAKEEELARKLPRLFR